MEQQNIHRLAKVAKEFEVGVSTLLDFFKQEGIKDLNPNSKINEDLYKKAQKKYGSEKLIKEKIREQKEQEAKLYKKTVSIEEEVEEEVIEEKQEIAEIVEEKPNLKEEKKSEKVVQEQKKQVEEKIKEENKLEGPKILGKIDLEPKRKIKTEEKSINKEKQKEPKKKEQKQEQIIPKKEGKKEQEKIVVPKVKKEEKKSDHKQEKHEHKQEKAGHKNIEKKTNQEEENQKIKEKIIIEEVKEKSVKSENNHKETEFQKIKGPTVLGKIDLDSMNLKTRPDKKTKKEKEDERIKRQKAAKKVAIDPTKKRDPKFDPSKKKKRPRIQKVDIKNQGKPSGHKPNGNNNTRNNNHRRPLRKKEVVITDAVDVQKQVRETLQKLEQRQKSKSAKFRKQKRIDHHNKLTKEIKQQEEENKILKLTEFITIKELADLMDTSAAQVIELCFDLGQPATINYRLDSELIKMISDEFNFKVEFVESSYEEELELILNDKSNQLVTRPPIVTVMGHVDHGKTSLLDFIRKENVVDSESGGITQHIGAYSVKLDENKVITFIDTPGHEAFTAMRARGTKVTDVAVIIIAADDSVMPQTEEAIDHARAANVPMIFAINKIDKPGADPERIKQQLAEKNLLVESWGGKYGCVEISAKKGIGIEELLERIWLESEMLELKSNPDRNAIATVLEARLDKGRGYITNIIIRTGTLKIGDIIVAGAYYGKVKAMYNELNKKQKEIGPSFPTQLLGLNGAPEPGDPVVVVDTEREARDKADQRMQIVREMELRARKKHTLEELSRRFAEGEKIDLNFIVKADVKGSVDAIVDQVTRLSNEEVSVNVVRNAVGQISDTDAMLAAASKAILIGFNVRPSVSARKLAEEKDVEIRLYSIIYDIINDVKAAVKGMLKPEMKEEIIGTAEVMDVFKVSKVGSIAGSLVRDGKIIQNSKIRLIRDGVVVFTGKLSSLKRFKDDAKEVLKGFDCGIGIENFNDIKAGDFIEAFTQTEVERS